VKRKYRLTRSTDFIRVRRLGKSYAHPFIVLVACPTPQPLLRFGIAAGRSVGKAVVRNRCKRMLRAALYPLLADISPGWDALLLARPGLNAVTVEDAHIVLKELLVRAKMINKNGKAYAG
jgi:ribonuclease P protein component